MGCGCFQERDESKKLAVARNALRRKFRRDNKLHPLEPEELENETGTPDLVFALKPVGPVKAEQLRAASPKPEIVDTPNTKDTYADDTVVVQTEVVKEANKDDVFHEQVRLYIGGIIKNALNIVKAEEEQKESDSLTSSIISTIADEAVSLSLTKIAVLDATVLDNNSATNIQEAIVAQSPASIGSSEISQIAELAVGESLSKIADSGNTNSSARRPRTVNEMLEYYGIPLAACKDGMPRVDI